VAKLRRQKYDLAILPGGGSASALRFAHWINAREVLIRDQQDEVAGAHEVEQCCNLLKRMGLKYETPATRIVGNEQEVEIMRIRLAAALPFAPRRLIGLHISARKPSQRWPVELFAKLAKGLATEGTAFLLLWAPGSADNPQHPGDDEKAARLLELGAELPIAPLPTQRLQELIAALSLCDTVICGDGGAMHVAAGLGKPIVCMFGQSNSKQWHPWGVPYELIQPQSKSVSDISVDQAISAHNALVTKSQILS
jgi:heptosyltransferase-3